MDNFKKKKLIFLHIGAIALLSLFFALFYFGIVKCPFRYIFGIPCPTCNMTRAVAKLLVFDFRGYFELNVMALPMYYFALYCKSFNVLPSPSAALRSFFASVVQS